MARNNREEAIARIMRGLRCTRKEAEDVYNYDRAVEHDEKTDFDLPPDKFAVARRMAHTGTRTVKKPMIPNLT